MKKIVLFLFLIFSLLILSQFSFAYFGKVNYPIIVKDEAGNSLRLTKQPERIVSCMPSITEMLFALGLGDRVVAVTENCNYPPEAAKKEKIGRDRMNIEKIVSLQPDLIVMLGSAQQEDIKKLKKLKMPVFVIDPSSVNGVMASLDNLGMATNRQNAAYSINETMKRKLRWLEARIKRAKIKKPTVFVEIWGRPLMTASKGTFIDDVVKLAGGKNIAGQARGKYPQFSMEKLIKIDPDVIIIPKQNVQSIMDIYDNVQWLRLKAVKGDKVIFIDADIISRPGPRVIKAVEEIVKFMYEKESAENAEEK